MRDFRTYKCRKTEFSLNSFNCSKIDCHHFQEILAQKIGFPEKDRHLEIIVTCSVLQKHSMYHLTEKENM